VFDHISIPRSHKGVKYPDKVSLVYLQPTADKTPTITSLSKLSGPPG